MKPQQYTIVYIADILCTGGVSSFLQSITGYMKKRGYHVLIVSKVDPAFNYPSLLPNCDVRVIRDRFDRRAHVLKKIFVTLAEWRAYADALNAILNTRHVAAVHYNNVLSAFGVFLLCPRVYQYPRIITVHGDRARELASEDIRHPIRSLHIFAMTMIQRFVLHRCTHIVGVSNNLTRHLRRKYPRVNRHIVCIKNGIDMPSVQLKRNGSNEKRVIKLINISRFEKRKGHALLLHAVASMLDTYPNITLDMFGPFRNDFYNLLLQYESLQTGTHIHIYPELTPKSRRVALLQSTLFIMPSLELENCPFSVIEALAMGIPVVATPVEGLVEMIRPVDRRLLAKNVTPEALAKAITWFLSQSRKEKIAISNRCKTIARQQYNSELNYIQYEKLYAFSPTYL